MDSGFHLKELAKSNELLGQKAKERETEREKERDRERESRESVQSARPDDDVNDEQSYSIIILKF